uniref:UDP-glucose 4-epimerase n=1 Tax=Trichuris muris TaxID=70415 RepID=A0A5S6Q8L5_TRIMR
MQAASSQHCILVTGAGGFVGSHVVLELLSKDYNVIAVDNCINCVKGSDDVPVSLSRVEKICGKKLTFYNTDVLDEVGLEKIFGKHQIDCVMHFAGLKAVGESVRMPIQYYWNNVTGALILLRVMQKCKVHNIIFSSSATVYGAVEFPPISEWHPAGIGMTNPYGKSKYFIEEILCDLHAADKQWNIVLLRYFNPVGAHPSGEIGEDPCGTPNNLMPNVSMAAAKLIPFLRVFGTDYDTMDGTGVRDYVHVVDLAKGHTASLGKIFSNCGLKVYNLGTGHGYSVLEVVKMFEEISGTEIELKFEERRPGDLPAVYCDASLADLELRWKAEHDLRQMCIDTWNWQTKNPKGYRD